MRKIDENVFELWEYSSNLDGYTYIYDKNRVIDRDTLIKQLDEDEDVKQTETEFWTCYEIPNGDAIICGRGWMIKIKDYSTTNREIGNYVLVQITVVELYNKGEINEDTLHIFRDL